MTKKSLITLIVILLLNLAIAPYTFAANNAESEAKLAAKVKEGINKLGVGIVSKIKVKLDDGTKVKGYVSEINEDSFTVSNEKTGEKTVVPYSKAKQIKGNNLSSEVIVGIGVVAFVIILFVLYGKAS